MCTNLPTGANPLTALHDLSVRQFNFSLILDFGRYTIRVDPDRGRGWFRAETSVNRDENDLVFERAGLGWRLVTPDEIPPQVSIALRRAGYAV